MKLQDNAIFSACAAAITFGVISLKINIKKVVIRVPLIMINYWSPYNCTAMIVTRVADAALAKLLHSKITLRSLSVSDKSFDVRRAALLPLLARCFNRYLLIDIRLVSDIEKNAETIRSKAKRLICCVSEK